ncbi:hypothetical protein, partial [Desulfoluna butyratoxydans]|uniref:hypothetical protein n=1 Tax=Desulfoluna butyratoxydans TaxID=231438 RepID=UPI001C54FE1F
GVVGVLSEAGGAIIERGRNVNGEYVRWADGTQICWLRVSPSNTPWQYLTKTVPAEFVQPPLTPASVILTFTGGAGGVISGQEMSVNGAYLGAPSVMMYRINSGNPDYELNAVVIGRWFE